MSEQDLASEGYLVLVQCCRSFPEGEYRFARYFKVALYNRLKELVQTERRLKRQGISVELVEAFGVPTLHPHLRESITDRIEELRTVLSDHAFEFLRQLAEPSPPVIEFAWREFCRRNKLHSQGLPANGYRQFRIKPRHIRKVFGWSAPEVKLFMRDIRRVYRTKILEGEHNACPLRKTKKR